jgi:hypothetical protein
LAHFGHAAIAELSPVSGIRRKLDFEPAKGSFWRKADFRKLAACLSEAEVDLLNSVY